MINLIEVPYIQQNDINSCGAAALEMIYKYYGLYEISQDDIFNKYKKLEPHGSGNYYIEVEDLIADSQSRGFTAEWFRSAVDYSGINKLKELVDQGIPVVVCQQVSKEDSLMGHFRIVTGVDNLYVYLHDPLRGGDGIKWYHKKFLSFWKKTGLNVTGGVTIIIKK